MLLEKLTNMIESGAVSREKELIVHKSQRSFQHPRKIHFLRDLHDLFVWEFSGELVHDAPFLLSHLFQSFSQYVFRQGKLGYITFRLGSKTFYTRYPCSENEKAPKESNHPLVHDMG